MNEPFALDTSPGDVRLTDDQVVNHSDVLQFNRDQLFSALKLAIPGATHDQLLILVRALESFASAIALEVLSQ